MPMKKTNTNKVAHTDNATKENVAPTQVNEKTITKNVTFAPTDTVLCRSITAGILYVSGKKSGNSYTFVGNGDEEYIEYQDLMALLMNKAPSIWKPRFIITDERIFEDFRFKRLKEVYDNLYHGEVEEILQLDKADFEATLRHAPEGLKEVIKTVIATRVTEGEFDSISKIKIVDKVCGTEIRKLLLEE